MVSGLRRRVQRRLLRPSVIPSSDGVAPRFLAEARAGSCGPTRTVDTDDHRGDHAGEARRAGSRAPSAASHPGR